ncbi:DUF1801 domain-containing protein [uncultured Maribacter sp.]|uniref:DUF1801 domain-containing protein n=1 Tax=uncultured Maribacter sp. TaxID=431308 RepID=UPI0030D94B80
MNKKVTDYLNGLTQWKDELTRLREIILDCNLVEDFKWMHPCYTYKGKTLYYCMVLKNIVPYYFTKERF